MKLSKFISNILALCLLLTLFVGCTNGVNQKEKRNEKSDVTNIFLSKNELTLGIYESATITATISPGNTQTTLIWSSSDDTVAEINDQGIVTAKSEGTAVIKVEASNGVLAICNVTVKIKTGSVSGNITYKYNDYVGNKPDTGATALLISKHITSLPNSIALGWISSLPEGCYGTKADGFGHYRLDNIPVGEYYIVIISKNTSSGSSSGISYWGPAVYNMFTTEGKEIADSTCFLYKIKTNSINILEDEITTFSHDFGITYF